MCFQFMRGYSRLAIHRRTDQFVGSDLSIVDLAGTVAREALLLQSQVVRNKSGDHCQFNQLLS
jgi:hypothetical protein